MAERKKKLPVGMEVLRQALIEKEMEIFRESLTCEPAIMKGWDPGHKEGSVGVVSYNEKFTLHTPCRRANFALCHNPKPKGNKMKNNRTIETLSEDLKTVNVWSVPGSVTLVKVIEKQNFRKFRDLYLVSQHPVRK